MTQQTTTDSASPLMQFRFFTASGGLFFYFYKVVSHTSAHHAGPFVRLRRQRPVRS